MQERGTKMKALLCQTNTTPGDFALNLFQIKDCMNLGFAQKVDLIVFPELSIPGYLCRDTMFRTGFVEQNLKALREITDHYRSLEGDPYVIVGYIDKNRTGLGKPFRNMAAVIKNGVVVATYAKHLLPFYDVFDEGRYFEPGKDLVVFDICGERWGLCICEDVWNDKGTDDYNYRDNPLSAYRELGVKNIISINSSPFVKGKSYKRIEMLRKTPADRFIYVNQVGGQDELVFDGHSFILEKNMVVGCMKDEFTYLYDSSESHAVDVTPVMNDYHGLFNVLKMGLKNYVHKSGFKEVVVGSSGGIDSAVVIALACEALGSKNVHAIRMPSVNSSEHSLTDAEKLHRNLGCYDYVVPIEYEEQVVQIKKCLGIEEYDKNADENIQARIRGLTVMYKSNASRVLTLTTGNKTELALGYCTLYGDMDGGFAPISDLYKCDVYALAQYYNNIKGKEIIPQHIMTKAPSAELAKGQTDEGNLKLPYVILDEIVRAYIEEYIGDFDHFKAYVLDLRNRKDILRDWVLNEDACKEYEEKIRLIDRNEFKRRQAAPGIKVCKVAFGSGRRLPIIKK